MRHPLTSLLAAFVLAPAAHSAAPAEADLGRHRASLEAAIATIADSTGPSPAPKAAPPVLPAQLPQQAGLGIAAISAAGYAFNWMVFSGGWHWSTTDEYSTFHLLQQRHASASTFGAILSLRVFRIAVTPSDAANLDLGLARENNATIYQNRLQVAFAGGRTAYRNSYGYYSNGATYSVDTWSLADAGITYQYVIFTTVPDWNVNKEIYGIMTAGFSFRGVAAAKPGAVAEAPHLSYHAAPGGGVEFTGLRGAVRIHIYDLSGNLIRTLSGTSRWDGLDAKGAVVRQGFYVTNVESEAGRETMKVLLRK